MLSTEILECKHRKKARKKDRRTGVMDGRRVPGKRSIEEMTRLFQFPCRSIRESSARVAHIYIPDRELSADRAEWSPCSWLNTYTRWRWLWWWPLRWTWRPTPPTCAHHHIGYQSIYKGLIIKKKKLFWTCLYYDRITMYVCYMTTQNIGKLRRPHLPCKAFDRSQN